MADGARKTHGGGGLGGSEETVEVQGDSARPRPKRITNRFSCFPPASTIATGGGAIVVTWRCHQPGTISGSRTRRNLSALDGTILGFGTSTQSTPRMTRCVERWASVSVPMMTALARRSGIGMEARGDSTLMSGPPKLTMHGEVLAHVSHMLAQVEGLANNTVNHLAKLAIVARTMPTTK